MSQVRTTLQKQNIGNYKFFKILANTSLFFFVVVQTRPKVLKIIYETI